MATTYTYPDAYLGRFCTEARETRAIDDVAVHGTFSDAWTERLVIAQTYILAALENQAQEDDLFAAKLKAYRDQFSALLPQAKRAAAEAAQETSSVGFFTVPMERS
jgi:hypothetical protein